MHTDTCRRIYFSVCQFHIIQYSTYINYHQELSIQQQNQGHKWVSRIASFYNDILGIYNLKQLIFTHSVDIYLTNQAWLELGIADIAMNKIGNCFNNSLVEVVGGRQ